MLHCDIWIKTSLTEQHRRVYFLQEMCILGSKEYTLKTNRSTLLNYMHFAAFAVEVSSWNFPMNNSFLSFLGLPLTGLMHHKQQSPLHCAPSKQRLMWCLGDTSRMGKIPKLSASVSKWVMNFKSDYLSYLKSKKQWVTFMTIQASSLLQMRFWRWFPKEQKDIETQRENPLQNMP